MNLEEEEQQQFKQQQDQEQEMFHVVSDEKRAYDEAMQLRWANHEFVKEEDRIKLKTGKPIEFDLTIEPEPEEDLSLSDNFKLWLMLAGYEVNYTNKHDEDLHFRYKQTLHVKQLQEDDDDCTDLGADLLKYGFDPDDTKAKAARKEEKQKRTDLENEYYCWKLDNWKMIEKNGWYGEIEMYYQFIKQKEANENLTKDSDD